MKRYLYILSAVAAMLLGCETVTTPVEPEVEFLFGEMSVETTHNSATITADMPCVTVDGKSVEASVWLQLNDGDNINLVEEYVVEEGKMVFFVDGLASERSYSANLVADGKEHGRMLSDTVTFTTQRYMPEVKMSYDATIDTKGLVATLYLRDVAYLVDDSSEGIHVVKVEYSPHSAEEWVAKELKGSALSSGPISLSLPFEGCDYLVENHDYKLRLTLYPENGNYVPLTSENIGFKTQFAEVTANVATPTLKVEGKHISASVEAIEVFYDGIASADYKDGYPVKYYFYHRVKGASQWSQTEVEAAKGNIAVAISAEEGNTYEVKALIVAGAMQKVCESAVAEIEVPKQDVPTPPTPPVGGGDTSSIAGVWHLTEWRGAKPSFDVYLDITSDGVVTLWQRIESRVWECFYSTATIVNGTISGLYSDGVAWGTSYNVTVAESSMTWVDVSDAADISVYTRSELPESMPTTVTRSVISHRFL